MQQVKLHSESLHTALCTRKWYADQCLDGELLQVFKFALTRIQIQTGKELNTTFWYCIATLTKTLDREKPIDKLKSKVACKPFIALMTDGHVLVTTVTFMACVGYKIGNKQEDLYGTTVSNGIKAITE